MTTDPARGMTTIPMLPSDPTAPAKAPAQLIAAPIPAGTIPAVVRPAVFLIADEELRLLDQIKAAGCVACAALVAEPIAAAATRINAVARFFMEGGLSVAS